MRREWAIARRCNAQSAELASPTLSFFTFLPLVTLYVHLLPPTFSAFALAFEWQWSLVQDWPISYFIPSALKAYHGLQAIDSTTAHPSTFCHDQTIQHCSQSRQRTAISFNTGSFIQQQFTLSSSVISCGYQYGSSFHKIRDTSTLSTTTNDQLFLSFVILHSNGQQHNHLFSLPKLSMISSMAVYSL